MLDFLIFWAVIGGMACIICLIIAGVSYDDRDRNAVRTYLKAALFCLVWPISLPVAVVLGIRKMYLYGFKGA